MKIRILKTGETKDFDESYALRLISDGQAVLPEKPAKTAKPEPKTDAAGEPEAPAEAPEKPARAARKKK